ncbi:armadillo-type protein [Peziza echinospora]|nr:armadillo-type protein [Peziza echinospora]
MTAEAAATAPSQTVLHLKKVLCDDSSPSLALRFRALFSLKHLATNGDLNAIDAIAAAFASDSALLKHELAYCLGQTKNPHITPHLTRVLEDLTEDPMVRHEAAEALGALGMSESIPLLTRFLTDPREEVRETCEIAIARLEWLASTKNKSTTTTATEPSDRGNIFQSIDPAPPTDEDNTAAAPSLDKVEKLRQTLTNAKELSLFERYRAMFRLRDIISTPTTPAPQAAAAIEALAAGFTDSSALFRHEVAFVFGQLAHPLSIPFLVPVAKDKNEHAMVRHEAVEALGSIGTEEVEGLLKEMVTPEEERVVRESAEVALDMAEFERSGGFEYALIPEVEVKV